MSRLGCRKDGARELMAHSWFASRDWEALLRRDVRPPWVPRVAGPFDTSHFTEQDDEDSDDYEAAEGMLEGMVASPSGGGHHEVDNFQPYDGPETWDQF